MSEFTVGDHVYRASRMDSFQQLAVARRLGPFVTAFFGTISAAAGENPLAAYQPILDAIGGMSDADANFILNTCLAVVSRRQPGGTGWAPILPTPGRLMFEDITPAQMLSISSRVLEAHRIADFFTDLLSLSGQPGATGQT